MKLISPSPAGRAYKRDVMQRNAWKVRAGLMPLRELRRWARNAARAVTRCKNG